jgi:xanthine dehydrogenase accessory factor/xanthine dehydrogenase large subunit
VTARLSDAIRSLSQAGEPSVLVTVARARGSTPREAGASMLVTATAAFGTIGGGRLEWEATRHARQMLADGNAAGELEMPLGPAVGQCCGGHVRLALRRADADLLAELEARERAAAAGLPDVLLFGAGHVGRALARALAPLPFRVRWIDGRADAFPADPVPGIEVVRTERVVGEAARAPAAAAHLVLTHSHALDFEICASVLERGDFAYLGLIGSATKRARFERGFRELGIAPATIRRLVCPIGGGAVRDKRPAVIAALVAAELITSFASRPEAPAPALTEAG